MKESIYIFIGGGLGSVSRYWLSKGVNSLYLGSFPAGTLVCNLVGCFLIGLWMVMMAQRFLINPYLRMFLCIGFLGGLTTFSTFSYETLSLFEGRSYLWAGLNILASLVGCLTAVYLGSLLAKA